MNTTLAELARLVGGRILGDPANEASDQTITGAETLDLAGQSDITLIDHVDRIHHLAESPAVAAVVPDDAATADLAHDELPALLAVADVHQAFTAIVAKFRPPRTIPRGGISPAAHIDATAQLDANVEVHPGATIGPDVTLGSGSTVHAGVHIMTGCEIGQDVTLMPGVVLYENTQVGPRSLIHAGAVIGAYGFGYQIVDGAHQRTAQLGYVAIGADVEIGANSTVDRGTYGATTIGEGTKLDNLVMIAHNCQIGRHNIICSQVGIAGSTTTGDYVVMAGQVGVRDHVHIGTGARLGAMAGISNDVAEHTTVFGAPATPEREQKLQMAAVAKLPQMRRQFKALKRAVAELVEQQNPKPEQRDDQAAA